MRLIFFRLSLPLGKPFLALFVFRFALSQNIFFQLQMQGATGSFKWPSPTKLHLIRPAKRTCQSKRTAWVSAYTAGVQLVSSFAEIRFS